MQACIIANDPMSSSWDDLPRRILTIGLGVPILWAFWWHAVTRWLFFQGLHVVLCLEYTLLVAASGTSSPSSSPSPSSGAGPTIAWLMQQSHLLRWIPVSVVLINIPNETLFLLALVLTEATYSIWNASSVSSLVVVAGAGNSNNSNNNNNSSNNKQQQLSAGNTGWLLLLTLPGRSWIHLSNDFCDTVSLLVTVWNCDTGALVVGRLYQSWRTVTTRRNAASSSSSRLLSWLHHVSPSKSMAGFVGGWLFGTITFCCLPSIWSALQAWHVVPAQDARSLVIMSSSVASSTTTIAASSWLARVLLGTLVSLAAMAGDLWESSVKRYYGVKDTSQLLPGHGGILDRFDSSLIAVLFWQWAKEQGLIGRL